MPRPHRIAKLLSDEDATEWQLLIADPLLTIDDLFGWLRESGYDVSRSATGHFVRRSRRGLVFDLDQTLGTRSDSAMRRQLAAWARRLSGVDLMSLVCQAAFLATVAETRRKGAAKGR